MFVTILISKSFILEISFLNTKDFDMKCRKLWLDKIEIHIIKLFITTNCYQQNGTNSQRWCCSSILLIQWYAWYQNWYRHRYTHCAYFEFQKLFFVHLGLKRKLNLWSLIVTWKAAWLSIYVVFILKMKDISFFLVLMW